MKLTLVYYYSLISEIYINEEEDKNSSIFKVTVLFGELRSKMWLHDYKSIRMQEIKHVFRAAKSLLTENYSKPNSTVLIILGCQI
jgi:hypothetical protein